MRKIIEMGSQNVGFDSSAGWLFEYQEQFGHDILPDIMPILEALLNVAGTVLADMGGKNETTAKEAAKAILGAGKEGLFDALLSLSGLETTTVIKIAWAMAKNNDRDIPEPKTWAKSFDVFPLDSLLPKLLELIITSSVSAKNAKSLLKMFQKKTEESESKNSSSQESTGGLA